MPLSEAGNSGVLIGPCRVGREHVYYPIDNPDRKWRLELLNRLINYLFQRSRLRAIRFRHARAGRGLLSSS
jgi:hypothetical protein